MPINLTPIAPPAPPGEFPDCADQIIVTPDQPAFEGCPVYTKSSSVTVEQTQQATVRWVMRTKAGLPINLQPCLGGDPPATVVVKIRNPFESGARTFTLEGSPVGDGSDGLIQFTLSADVVKCACLYTMDIGIVTASGSLLFGNRGLLSVEPNSFGDNCESPGVLTLGEIRTELRDFAAENPSLGDVEFDESEIIAAIRGTVDEWNETPPDVASFSACEFPFREHWKKAVCGRLLRTAAVWYERARFRGEGGGLSVDDRNKMNTYLGLAKTYTDEWKMFIERKKIEININLGYGIVG
jgi:hypothetical protein